MRRLVVCAVLLAALGARPAAGKPPQARDPGRGQRLFQRECASCHGPAGEGDRGPTLAVPSLARAKDQATLVKLIRSGIEGTEMPAARLEKADVELVAAWVRALGRRPVERVPGDPQAGRALYLGKGGCPACHVLDGQGGALGPDLTDIGLRRGAAYLRTSLIDPDAAVPVSHSPFRQDVSIVQNFLYVRAVTRAGREVIGVRVNEDTFSIQIRDATNAISSFWKSELSELDKRWGRSPMPSYKDALAAGELDDLVAFLLSLRGG